MYFSDIIFGPIQSRRLGVSLGINLLPKHGKLCNFDCIYCECGWNKEGREDKNLPSRQEVQEALSLRLQQMQDKNELPDAITFSGNGEPTIHPEFAGIIDDVLTLRNIYAPKARVCVLSNATNLDNANVFDALQKIDAPILKLDSGFAETVRLIDCPQNNYAVEKVVEGMQRFKGNFILQTMFLRGDYKGAHIDNTTSAEVNKWLEIVAATRPHEVMIYTIDRATPASGLEKVPLPELEQIADKVRALGISVRVSG